MPPATSRNCPRRRIWPSSSATQRSPPSCATSRSLRAWSQRYSTAADNNQPFRDGRHIARGEALACCQALIDRAFSRKNKRGDGHDRCVHYGLRRAGDRLARPYLRDHARLEALAGLVAGAESLLLVKGAK